MSSHSSRRLALQAMFAALIYPDAAIEISETESGGKYLIVRTRGDDDE